MPHTVVRVALDRGIHRKILYLGTDELLQILGDIGVIQVIRDDVTGMIFDVLPPEHIPLEQRESWAAHAADEFQAKTHNAVPAPPIPR